MSLEEAAERILAGEPFKPCLDCGGLGFTVPDRVEPTFDNGGQSERIEVCNACILTGWVYDEAYLRACRVLGRPKPPLPKPFRRQDHSPLTSAQKAALEDYAKTDTVVTTRLMADLRLHPAPPERE